MNLATNETYNVVAVAPSGARKTVARRVGAFRASKLAAKVKALGFDVEVNPTNATVVALKD